MASISQAERESGAGELTQAAFVRLPQGLDEGRDSDVQRYLAMHRRMQSWLDRKRVAATYNERGKVEGVKSPQLTVVLTNPSNEQQALLECQQPVYELRAQKLEAKNAAPHARLRALERRVGSRHHKQ